MRQRLLLFLLVVLFVSCGPQPEVPSPTGTPLQTAAAPAHAPEIRFALVGEPRDVNVWELFDESGASYADYALRNEYWPRLYHLPLPEFTFQPLAAEDMPSPVVQEGEFYSAVVRLRQDLKWTDGRAFTAEDVAFTVNTALAFELGYDWNASYSMNYLARAEAPDSHTVKFLFKQQPNVGIWQYGALQGPIVQKAFWEPILQRAAGLLPDDSLRTRVDGARARVLEVQVSVADLTAQVDALRLSGGADRKLEASLTANQNELIFAQNSLDELLEQYDTEIEAARRELYAADDEGEPTLGTWMPAAEQEGAWTNVANPDFPFTQPNFDRASYFIYPDLESAFTAFEENKVDVILNPGGTGQFGMQANPTNHVRFLVFNSGRMILTDPAVRRAIACVVDQDAMTSDEQGQSYDGFTLNGPWRDTQLSLVCSGLPEDSRLESAINVLKQAGYRWTREPTAEQPGTGLSLPDGTLFPSLVLLTAAADDEPLRAAAADAVRVQAGRLGIPMTVETTDFEGLQYAIYSSGEYDLAIFGWRLSLYPEYLCGWFGAGGHFEYGRDGLQSECEALTHESGMDAAIRHAGRIQSSLMEDLPFLPLYATFTHDTYQNIQYPFEAVPGGVAGFYGAPSLAYPVR